ncbi:hypothetical protein NDU88_005146 [Pleurodeles waltl]|uniref:Uncharacterized protein n=1 Tax=Pleurodeles waltl TaxID=8319 RepID=A0AAV7QF65_PLEWA|nr:hypothetical protein NDU88_005146 [Pleurodeles waltl]
MVADPPPPHRRPPGLGNWPHTSHRGRSGSSPPNATLVAPGSNFVLTGRLHTSSPLSDVAVPSMAGLRHGAMPEGQPQSPAAATQAALLTPASLAQPPLPCGAHLALADPQTHPSTRDRRGNLGAGWWGLLPADDRGVRNTLRVRLPS